MTNEIAESGGTDFNIRRKEDVDAHIVRLGELAKVVNRAMSAMMAFEIRINFSINELEAARRNASATDLHKISPVLTAREAARMLDIPVQMLGRDRGQHFPKPVRGSGVRAIYSREEIEGWLLAKLEG